MKNHILGLLTSDSLVDYLEGVHLFCTGLRERRLAQREIDAVLMERVAAVVGIEGWTQHTDFVEKFEHIVDQMEQYGPLLTHEDANGEAFRGILLFLNGVAQGQHNTAGFASSGRPESGWLLCMQAGERLAGYYDGQGNFMATLFFKDMAEWFGSIHSAQVDFIDSLSELTEWNEESAEGFYVVLTQSAPFFQGLLLGALGPVARVPVVRTVIFDRYLGALQLRREELAEAGEAEQVVAMDTLIGMVQTRREGGFVPLN